MALVLKGEEVAEAVRAWMTNEIRTAPSFGHDMGKHFFSTSAATIGVIATLAKLGPDAGAVPAQLAVAIGLLFLAAVVGLLLSVPSPRAIRTDTDLFAEYRQTIRRLLTFSAVWLLLWLVGAFWGLVVVL